MGSPRLVLESHRADIWRKEGEPRTADAFSWGGSSQTTARSPSTASSPLFWCENGTHDDQDAIHGCPRGCRGASPSSGLPAAVRQDKTATRMGPGLPARNRAVERIAANRSGAGCRHEARPCTSCRGHKAGAPSTSRRREGARLRPGELSRRREGRVPNGLRRRGATRCCRCRGSRNGSER